MIHAVITVLVLVTGIAPTQSQRETRAATNALLETSTSSSSPERGRTNPEYQSPVVFTSPEYLQTEQNYILTDHSSDRTVLVEDLSSVTTNASVFPSTDGNNTDTLTAPAVQPDSIDNNTVLKPVNPAKRSRPVFDLEDLLKPIPDDDAPVVRIGGISIHVCPELSCSDNCFQGMSNSQTYQPSLKISASGNESAEEIDSRMTKRLARKNKKCSCHHSCLTFGDCCVDFFSLCLGVTNDTEVVQVVEDGGYHKANSSKGKAKYDVDPAISYLIRSYGSCVQSEEGRRYTMITRCSPSFTQSQTSTACEQENEGPNTAPYSHTQYGALTFKNIYCAHCHGYGNDKLLQWTRGMACKGINIPRAVNRLSESDVQNAYLKQFLSAIRSGNCTTIYRPPESLTIYPRHCLHPSLDLSHSHTDLATNISSTTKTENRCTADHFVLCKAYSYRILISELEVKNPHCLMCMTGAFPDSGSMECAKYDSDSFRTLMQSGKPNLDKAGKGGILALFSTDMSTGMNYVTLNGHKIPWSATLCKDDEVFDDIFFVCRTLFCPPRYRPINGRCSFVDRYFVPATSQIVPLGTKQLYITVDLESSVLCNDELPIFKKRFQNGFKDAYDGHSNDAVDPNVQTLTTDFSCHPFESDTKAVPIRDNSLAQQISVYLTMYPISNLSRTLDALKMVMEVMYSVDSAVIVNYLTHPEAQCEQGNAETTHHDRSRNIEGQRYVERSERNVTAFYAVTNTAFRLRFSKSKTKGIQSLYETTLCVGRQTNSTLNCSFVAIDINDTRVVNRTLFIIGTERSYPESRYEFQDGFVLVCSNFKNYNGLNFFKFDSVQYYISLACSTTSILFLLASLLAFVLLPHLRTVAGRMTASLAGSLATGQVLILVDFINDSVVCSVIAAVSHFCWLSAFTWMTALALHMTCTFFGNVSISGKHSIAQTKKEYRKYGVGCWGMPAMLVLTCFTFDTVEDTPPKLKVGYGTPLCGWIRQSYFFLIPVALALAINVVCFLITFVSIERTVRASKTATGQQKARDRQRVVVYVKMMSIMGLTWLAGFVAAFTEIAVLWWIYIVLNGLQGTFISFSFIFNRRLLRNLKARFEKRNQKGKQSGSGNSQMTDGSAQSSYRKSESKGQSEQHEVSLDGRRKEASRAGVYAVPTYHSTETSVGM